MEPDRLYLCPDCDEWIIEDEWDAHHEGCRPRMLHELSEQQLADLIQYREQNVGDWAGRWEIVERWVADAVAYWNGGAHRAYDGPWTTNFSIQPASRYWTGGPGISMPPVQEMHVQKIVVKLPRWLQPEWAEALAREQINEQLERIYNA